MNSLILAFCLSAASSTVRASGQEPSAPGSPATPVVIDAAARAYVSRCTGCHTIGKGVSTGPDLVKSITWQPPDLRAAIVRMQDKTGPIPPDDIDALITFLKDEMRDARIAAEEQRLAALFAVELDPPSAEMGRALFMGKQPFENSGTACVACHPFSDTDGGNLGPDLTGVVARLGRQGLMSATEKPAFKVMAPMYLAHPITRQEALHLTRFFEDMDKGVGLRPKAPWIPSAVLVVLGLFCTVWFARRHGPRATRSNSRGPS